MEGMIRTLLPQPLHPSYSQPIMLSSSAQLLFPRSHIALLPASQGHEEREFIGKQFMSM